MDVSDIISGTYTALNKMKDNKKHASEELFQKLKKLYNDYNEKSKNAWIWSMPLIMGQTWYYSEYKTTEEESKTKYREYRNMIKKIDVWNKLSDKEKLRLADAKTTYPLESFLQDDFNEEEVIDIYKDWEKRKQDDIADVKAYGLSGRKTAKRKAAKRKAAKRKTTKR